MSDPILTAQKAIADLGQQIENAQRRASAAELAADKMLLELRKLQERRFGPMAECLTRCHATSIQAVPSMLAHQIDIHPTSAHFRMLDRELLLDSKNPVAVVHENIEQVLKLHTEHLREQLRKAAWSLVEQPRSYDDYRSMINNPRHR